MSKMTRKQGLAKLVQIEGFRDELSMLEEATFDSVVPGICLTCGYSNGVEPDSDGGWCEECNKGSVVSCLILADII